MRANMKKTTLSMMRESEQIYIIMSQFTHLPYVICDAETYDDEILLFYTEEDAKREAAGLMKEKNLVQIVKIERKNFLAFYTSLYSMGVNCIVVNNGTPQRIAVQLNELITRVDSDKMPKGQVRVENPELHLTAIYFRQELQRRQSPEMTEEMKALNEEMTAHFRKGRYIVAVQEDQGVPVLKEKDGRVYQPVFTDIQEFNRFNREKKFKAMVIEADKIVNILLSESAGIVVNPLGVNIRFQMTKKDVKKAR